jgi:NSS family neurotransmitter:Na+ symporter
VFILACIGSAVGVGNIWRFPYLAAENGGGTFIAVYIFAILLLGLPILLLELLAGKALSTSPVKSFEKIKKGWVPLYYANFFLVILLFSYYVVITGWTLGYFTLSLGQATTPFSEFSQTYWPVLFTLIVMALISVVMRVDIRKGLEKVNSFFTPLLYVLLLVLLFEAMQLPMFSKAMEYYTTIDTAKLMNPSFWLVVISQAIFSLSIGQGIMLAYGSYLSKKSNLGSSSITIVSADTLASLLAAIIVFSIMFTYSISPNSGPSLSFEALPMAFSQMQFGDILMPVFFLMLFAAAFTSAISLAEVVIANFQDMFKLSRRGATTVCVGLITLLMFPSALSYSKMNLTIFGQRVLDVLDVSIVGRFLPLSTFLTVVYIAWGYKYLEKEAKANLPGWSVFPFLFLVRYIIPIFLFAISVAQFL